MFTEILKDEKLNEIIELFKKKDTNAVITKINTLFYELGWKNNEFVTELVIDKTILNICKIKKQRERAQDGHIQLGKFRRWLLDEFSSERALTKFDKVIVDILNRFEEYIIRLKERETALLEIIASWGSIILAIMAIIISIVAINI